MAVQAMTRLSERWLDEVLLAGTALNSVGGTFFLEQFTLPDGLGDVAIMEVGIAGFSLATVNPAAKLGLWSDVRSSDGATIVDILGTAEWFQVSADEVRSYLSPDPLVLLRQGELLSFVGPELDTNAAPTGDLRVLVKATRIRAVEQELKRPIRLVR